MLYSCQFVRAESCHKLLIRSEATNLQKRIHQDASSIFEETGGIIIRLHQTHNDGFGDLMSSLELAKSLKRNYPEIKVVIYIDSPETFQRLGVLHEEFRADDFNNNVIQGIPIISSPLSSDLNLPEGIDFQIIRIAANSPAPQTGILKYNLYLEEPGAPFQSFNKINKKLNRGQMLNDIDGNVHFRMNPGLDDQSFGFDLPHINKNALAKSRESLIERLNSEKGLDLDPSLISKESRWSYVYRYKRGESFGESYYRALYDNFVSTGEYNPVYIFDFSQDQHVVQKSNFPDFLRFRFLSRKGRSKSLMDKFNHINEDGSFVQGWISTNKKSPFTIIHSGPVNQNLALEFLNQSDFPALVTGTQSLFEALALEVPFYYEILSWKLDLLNAMAKHALLNFSKNEANFLIGLLTGDTESLSNPLKYSQTLMQVEDFNDFEWKIVTSGRTPFLIELFNSEERKALFTRFIKSLKSKTELIENIHQVANEMTQEGNK